MNSGVIDHRTRPTGRPAPLAQAPVGTGTMALRLSATLDPDLLREQLGVCWQASGGRRRDRSTFAMSVVESCARSRQARERDALRLLALEAADAPAFEGRDFLRATLVSLDAAEHLLLLAVAPKECTAALLRHLVDELARRYPVSTIDA
jgi:hypothetical protein